MCSFYLQATKALPKITGQYYKDYKQKQEHFSIDSAFICRYLFAEITVWSCFAPSTHHIIKSLNLETITLISGIVVKNKLNSPKSILTQTMIYSNFLFFKSSCWTHFTKYTKEQCVYLWERWRILTTCCDYIWSSKRKERNLFGLYLLQNKPHAVSLQWTLLSLISAMHVKGWWVKMLCCLNVTVYLCT